MGSVCLFSKFIWFRYKCFLFGLFYVSGGGVISLMKNSALMSDKRAMPVLSLNVNGLGNPVKRSKIINKLKKEKTLVNLLQETHLSEAEHEKLKRFGFRHTYYSSHYNTRQRGVTILISNHIQFDFHKKIKDSNGQYLILKGILDQTPVTLVNIYAPPGSNKSFFKSLFEIIVKETGCVYM